jgi:hypothetical protein
VRWKHEEEAASGSGYLYCGFASSLSGSESFACSKIPKGLVREASHKAVVGSVVAGCVPAERLQLTNSRDF